MAANIVELMLAKNFAEQQDYMDEMELVLRPDRVKGRGYPVALTPAAIEKAKANGDPHSPPLMRKIICAGKFFVDEDGKITKGHGIREIQVYLKEPLRNAREIYIPAANGDTMKVRMRAKNVWELERILETDVRALVKASILQDRMPLYTEV